MKIDLPQWKPEYEPKISESGYDKLLDEIKPLLDRCLQIYEAYLRTGNEVLYEVFNEAALKMYPKIFILSVSGSWREFARISKQIAAAAEIISKSDELPYKSTMLYDQAGVIKGM